ncbi:hypothetical protein ATE47_09110 [Chryseobacterium sp. IHB B 17019]|uniref:hypothetical protein n=1 Tax=Chryseobacterium sp. IHB B 17019 TaxID=1721091 RepID=UPI0007202731|nr:hypothetical protein [Chryseobacterium sp. IHB B 17019]ALR30675.1 hypothetical protein ATE47_09110 [Chryseobacterium sp. IHB B 17019]
MIGIIDITASHKFNKQAIVTKFLVIFVPIFPTGHYFIDKKNSAEYKAKKCRENLLKGYLLTSIPFVFLISIGVTSGSNFSPVPLFIIYGVIVTMFSLLYNVRSKDEVEEERLLFQKSITLNALPEYLVLKEQIKIRDFIVTKLKTYLRDYDMDWIDNVKTGNYDSFSLPLYFAAMGYEKEINKTDENLKNYKILKDRYSEEVKNKQLATQ